MRRLLVLVVLGAVLVGGSTWGVQAARTDDADTATTPARVAADDEMDVVQSTKAPESCALPTDATLADANLGFAWRSFRQVDATSRAKDEPTTTYSPYSAVAALHMLANGADSGTDERLLAALCLRGLTLGAINRSAGDLRVQLERGDEVEVANAIWTSPLHTPTPRMDTIIQDQFDGQVGRFEFGNAAPLNAWIKDRTKGRVPQVLSDEDLDLDMVMLLANAFTFDGTWAERFEDPRPGPFTRSGAEPVDVPMLRDLRTLDYAFSETDPELQWADVDTLREQAHGAFDMVRIPYKGGRFAMVLVVPRLDDGLDEVIDSMDAARWRELRERLAPIDVALSMPTLDLQEVRDIKDDLAAIGVPLGTYNRLINEPEDPMKIEFVKQGTGLQVDAKGTKAAAVTVVGVSASAGGPIGVPVDADHPYLLAIEELKTGELLMISAVRDAGTEQD